MAETSSDCLDDFQDLHNLSKSQVFGPFLSQASSYYGDGDEVCVDLIKHYSSQTPDEEPVSGLTLANVDVLVSTQTSTATESSSTTLATSQTSFGTMGTKSTVATSLSSLGSSSALGKRKASDRLGSEPSSPKRKPPFILLREPLQDAKPQFKMQPPEDIDSSKPVVLSPPTLMLGMFRKLPYGAQFEFVRLVSHGILQYNDLEVQDIIGIQTNYPTNATAAPEILKLILSKRRAVDVPQMDDNGKSYAQFVPLSDKELRARNPWEELDREEAALASNPYGAMGYQDDGQPAEWYGGQVQFRGILHYRDNLVVPGQFTLKLDKPVLGPSFQLTRRLGSNHFIRVRLSKQAKNHSQGAYEHLRKPFIICGHVYRAFFAKDDNAFLVRTNEFWDGKEVSPRTKPEGRATSFLDFIKWFNALDLNEGQPMAKWASRFSLGLSTSAPGFRLDRNQIEFRNDLVNETKENMTDGAGQLNRTLVRFLRHHYDWKERPSAFQVRVYGSKGLLVEDAANRSDKPAICLTPSQQKIKYPDSDNDPSHLAVDILRASHLRTPCRLSTEIIVNLAENGVGKESFIKLLENSMKEAIEPFFDWDTEGTLPRMWRILERRGGVIASRRAREQPGIARVKGWSERDVAERDVEESEVDDGERSTAWWPDVISGCPSGLEETVMFLLDSGFTPRKCPVLRDKLKKIVQRYIDRETRAFRVEVPMSATGFIVPDWSGVLEEGEVFMKSSERNLELPDGSFTDILMGDVLLARHPCKLPTDVRKWKAVDKPELHNLVDVIVLATKGKRRAADWLAGGDYDGDKAIIIWQPELVDPFKNAPDRYADEPANISEYFEREIEQVSSFRRRVEGLTDVAKIRELQHYLLGAIRIRSVVGQYSNCHEVATYMRGYDDAETRRLAFMFCLTLDGAKSGMTIKKDIHSKDMEEYGARSPLWKEWKESKDQEDAHTRSGGYNLPAPPKRKRGARRFIMDELQDEAQSQATYWRQRMDPVFNNVVDEEDFVLSAPYREILGKTRGPGGDLYRSDLDLIKRHVEEEYEARIKSTNKEREVRNAGGQQSPRKSPRKGAAFTERPIEERQDILRAASWRFAQSPDPDALFMTQEQVERVKASYAYYRDCHHKNWDPVKDGPREGSKKVHCTRFPFNVALRTLCDIKARSLGNHKTVCSGFYEHVVVKPPKPQQ